MLIHNPLELYRVSDIGNLLFQALAFPFGTLPIHFWRRGNDCNANPSSTKFYALTKGHSELTPLCLENGGNRRFN